MANSSIIFWVTEQMARVLPLTKVFEPVHKWDKDARKFTDEQETKDGVLVWESQVLLQTGWNADLTPVRIRMASVAKPTVQPNSEALMSMLSVSATPQRRSEHREGAA